MNDSENLDSAPDTRAEDPPETFGSDVVGLDGKPVDPATRTASPYTGHSWVIDSINAAIASADAAGDHVLRDRLLIPDINRGREHDLADVVRGLLRDALGHDPVFDEDALYGWAATHWRRIEHNDALRLVDALHGMPLPSGGKAPSSLDVSDARARAAVAILCRQVERPGFFAARPAGVALRNGFLALDEAREPVVRPHAPDQRQRFVVDIDYDPNMSPGEPADPRHDFRRLFAGISDGRSEKVALLGEMAGAALFGLGTTISQPKAFYLVGPANCGKSTLLDAIKRLIPPEAQAGVKPEAFDDPQMRAQLPGVHLNAADDIDFTRKTSASDWKPVVTGEEIMARHLYRNPFPFRPRAVHVFTSNDFPDFRSSQKSTGIRRRLLPIKFDRPIPAAEFDDTLVETVLEHDAQRLMAWVVAGAQRLLKNKAYSTSAATERATNEWLDEMDPVRTWAELHLIPEHGSRIRLGDAYKRFRIDQETDGEDGRQITKKTFSARLREQGYGIRKSSEMYIYDVRMAKDQEVEDIRAREEGRPTSEEWRRRREEFWRPFGEDTSRMEAAERQSPQSEQSEPTEPVLQSEPAEPVLQSEPVEPARQSGPDDDAPPEDPARDALDILVKVADRAGEPRAVEIAQQVLRQHGIDPGRRPIAATINSLSGDDALGVWCGVAQSARRIIGDQCIR